MFEKTDQAGNYIEFPGVTIIAPTIKISPEDDLFHKIYQSLSNTPLLTEYYAPLPYESYHMTTCNLYTQNEHSPGWQQFITDKLEFFQELATQLHKHEFTPEVSIEAIQVGRALQLRMAVPQHQQAIIRTLAKIFALEEGIPAFFHITLAYGYKEITDPCEQQKLVALSEELIAPYKNQKITLNVPALSYFESMQAFIPWDGKNYPFNEHQQKKTNRFFDMQQTSPTTSRNENPGTNSCKLTS